jgi:sporulation protein YlmC with PRC-barrel domain
MTTASGHTSAITATRVIGTPVRNLAGRKIGHIEDIVLDKLSNNILFAVVGFGGFLDIAEKFHPLPWEALDYRPDDGSYIVSFTKEQLQAAPADSLEALTEGDAMGYRNRAVDYYYSPGPR